MLKKLTALFTALLMLTAGCISASAAGMGKGDVNSDGRIDVTDISITAAHIKGIKSLSSSQQKLADVDGNGRIEVTDISIIAAHIKGIKSLGGGQAKQDPAKQLFDYSNNERKAAGLTAYKQSDELNRAAQIRAKELPAKFSHTRPNGSRCFTVLDELGINYWAVSENIAGGQGSAKEANDDFMNSTQGHREAILSTEYTHMGTACYYDSGSRTYYWVQIFAKF